MEQRRERGRLPQVTPDEHTANFAHYCPDDDDTVHFAGLSNTGPSNDDLPAKFTEAQRGPDGERWSDALAEELRSLHENKVYEEVPIPDGVKPFTIKIVMRLKFDASGHIERYKVRIVARGSPKRRGPITPKSSRPSQTSNPYAL